MGVWDFISGTADSVKRNAPDHLTSVKSWGSISYEYTKAGVNGVYNAVKVNTGGVLSQHWPSEETRSKILPFAVNVAKYSAQEALKYYIPGLSLFFFFFSLSICLSLSLSLLIYVFYAL